LERRGGGRQCGCDLVYVTHSYRNLTRQLVETSERTVEISERTARVQAFVEVNALLQVEEMRASRRMLYRDTRPLDLDQATTNASMRPSK
jgi:hypothetical protein